MKERQEMAVINRVPDLVAEKFGGREKVNLTRVQEETGLNYGTVLSWMKGHVNRADFNILEVWCKYLGVGVGEILVYKPE
jgi:DNA-binding Xre family transcriptional regulator